MAFRLKTFCNWLINRLSSDHASNALAQPKHPAKCHLRVSNKKNKICHFFHWILASYGRVGYTKMSFAQVAKGYLSTIANKNSFSLITNMRVASVSTAILSTQTCLQPGPILSTLTCLQPGPILSTLTCLQPGPILSTQTCLQPGPILSTQTCLQPGPILSTLTCLQSGLFYPHKHAHQPGPILSTQTCLQLGPFYPR